MLDSTTGYPRLGRHVVKLEDVRAQLVDAPEYAGSVTRAAVWDDLETAIGLLANAVLVHALWIGGSFVSDKLDPGDVDVAFVVNQRDLRARSVDDRKVVESFARRDRDAFGRPVPAHGLRVDSFIIRWEPFAELDPWKGPPEHREYAASRGYWDDFWGRVRQTPKAAPTIWKDALPRRGYLEVVINDFTR